MKYFELDKEEKKIRQDFNVGDYKSLPSKEKLKKQYQKIAQSSMKKVKNINIRLSEKDLQKIKSKAIEQGIPYQTLVCAVIHQYINNSSSNKEKSIS